MNNYISSIRLPLSILLQRQDEIPRYDVYRVRGKFPYSSPALALSFASRIRFFDLLSITARHVTQPTRTPRSRMFRSLYTQDMEAAEINDKLTHELKVLVRRERSALHSCTPIKRATLKPIL